MFFEPIQDVGQDVGKKNTADSHEDSTSIHISSQVSKYNIGLKWFKI